MEIITKYYWKLIKSEIGISQTVNGLWIITKMLLKLIITPISAALDIVLAIIPKKLLLVIIIILIAVIYFGYNF